MKSFKRFINDMRFKDLHNNPKFRKWFGMSKVTENGEPLVVFNGSSAGKTVFKRRSESLSGFYFSVFENVAEFYADEAGGGDVYPCYLKIEHPIYLPHVSKKDQHNSGLIDEERYAALKKEHGYFDGVIGYSLADKEPVEYVVFDPKQIKHIENNGDFNPSADNIYK
jgi:hypothetical protein